MIAAYTVVFAMCIGLMTNSRRVEVFAATAAYVSAPDPTESDW